MRSINSKSSNSPRTSRQIPAKTKVGEALKTQLSKGTLKLKTLEKTIQTQEAKGYQLVKLHKSKSGGLVNELVFQKLGAKPAGQKLNLHCTHAPADVLVTLSKQLFVEGGIQMVKGWRVRMASKGGQPL